MIKVGSLLIASPEISSGLYTKGVILVCEHSEAGSVGILINKTLPTQSPEEKSAISRLEDHQIITLLGGPIHPDEAFMLHNNPNLAKDSIELAQGVYLGSLIPMDPEDKTHSTRLIFGYSGWGPGQLEKEVTKGLWIQVPLKGEFVFSLPLDTQWFQIIKSLGGRYKALASFPARLDLN
jgi:putative transcriptional regulator